MHGKLYNPHSQGIVERVHRTVRNGLISLFLENESKFNLSEALKKVVNTYNNTAHRTIKNKPIDIFFSEDKNFFIKIKEITINSSKNYNGYNEFIIKNDYVLLYNNFTYKNIKKKNVKILEKSKVKNKNVLYNICVSVLDNNGDGTFRILIEKGYEKYGLSKNDICPIHFVLFKKLNYEQWKFI